MWVVQTRYHKIDPYKTVRSSNGGVYNFSTEKDALHAMSMAFSERKRTDWFNGTPGLLVRVVDIGEFMSESILKVAENAAWNGKESIYVGDVGDMVPEAVAERSK